MSSKDALSETGSVLTRAAGTLSVLRGVAPEALAAAQVELEAYQTATSTLETKAKALEEHLTALATLLPEVRQETRALKQRNKRAYALVQRVLEGKPVKSHPERTAPKTKPIPPAPTESAVIASEATESSAPEPTPAPKAPTPTRRRKPASKPTG